MVTETKAQLRKRLESRVLESAKERGAEKYALNLRMRPAEGERFGLKDGDFLGSRITVFLSSKLPEGAMVIEPYVIQFRFEWDAAFAVWRPADDATLPRRSS